MRLRGREGNEDEVRRAWALVAAMDVEVDPGRLYSHPVAPGGP